MPLFTSHYTKKKLCTKLSVIQQRCDIIIAKVSHDSSHLSLWPKKVLEEFLNPRTSFPTESSQFLRTFIIVIFQESARGVFQSRERIPGKLEPPNGVVEPPFGLVQPSDGLATQPPSPTPHPAEYSYRWEFWKKKKYQRDQFYSSPSQVPLLLIMCKFWSESYTTWPILISAFEKYSLKPSLFLQHMNIDQ